MNKKEKLIEYRTSIKPRVDIFRIYRKHIEEIKNTRTFIKNHPDKIRKDNLEKYEYEAYEMTCKNMNIKDYLTINEFQILKANSITCGYICSFKEVIEYQNKLLTEYN